MTDSIQFFETQFRRQVAQHDLLLNPFEAAVLPYLRGAVLDLGCGLGNLAVAAARQGCTVLALDAAPTAVAHLAARARQEGLAIRAQRADLRSHEPAGSYDTVVSIGLLMFFDAATARRQLARLQACVRPGGIAAVNVLVEGTTFLDMFDPAEHYLFGRGELHDAFAGWEIRHAAFDDRPAAGGRVKRFVTVVARKPDSGA